MENLVAIELAYINTKHPDFRPDASLASTLVSDEEKARNIPVRRIHGNAPSTYEHEQPKVRRQLTSLHFVDGFPSC